MKNKVMSYRLGDIIRKEYEQSENKKPDDIGTKPVPKWLQDKETTIEEIFGGDYEDTE
jgi:hypothetical protein